VALGNTYYYFRSKEHLVQAFYERVNDAQRVETAAALVHETDLKTRLRVVVRAVIEIMQPYHRFAGSLFRSAADPRSPLSPFGPESTEARRKGIALLAEVVDGSKTWVPDDLRAELPRLLWLYQMGVVLFWIHDRSPEYVRTERLIDHTTEIVVRLISLASLPVLRPLRRRTLRLLTDLQVNELSLSKPV
jgi:AcrR family transcriptional regulator